MKRLSDGLGIVAAAALFGMMTLTFVDVIGRKLLSSSVTGSVELTELMMLALIFVAMPLTSLHAEHVVFDLLDNFLPSSLRPLLQRLSNLICVGLLSGAAWLVYERAVRTAQQGDTTAQLQLPMAPFFYGAAVLLALTGLMHLVLAIRPDAHIPTDGVSGA